MTLYLRAKISIDQLCANMQYVTRKTKRCHAHLI